MARVATGQPPAEGPDLSKYDQEPPAYADATKPEAWDAALNKLKIQASHMQLRSTNLDLMKENNAGVRGAVYYKR